MSEVAVRLRSQRRSWAHPGSGHDRIVRVLMWGLPIGIGVLAALLVVTPIFSGGDVSFVLDKNKVDIAGDRLRVEAAEYRGEDAKGRPFRLKAGSAVQKSSAEPIVRLSDLYDMNARQLAVDGPITFRTADGYSLDTHDATVDLKTKRMQSGGAVSGRTPMGVFSGNRMTADLQARTVSLDGNARLRIVPRQANRR